MGKDGNSPRGAPVGALGEAGGWGPLARESGLLQTLMTPEPAWRPLPANPLSHPPGDPAAAPHRHGDDSARHHGGVAATISERKPGQRNRCPGQTLPSARVSLWNPKTSPKHAAPVLGTSAQGGVMATLPPVTPACRHGAAARSDGARDPGEEACASQPLGSLTGTSLSASSFRPQPRARQPWGRVVPVPPAAAPSGRRPPASCACGWGLPAAGGQGLRCPGV